MNRKHTRRDVLKQGCAVGLSFSSLLLGGCPSGCGGKSDPPGTGGGSSGPESPRELTYSETEEFMDTFEKHIDEGHTVHVSFDGSAKLTTTLAHALSDVSGIDVTDTGFTLYDHVDPDALDQLFKPTDDGQVRMNGLLTFTVWGHQVTVYSDGRIAIVPPPAGRR